MKIKWTIGRKLSASFFLIVLIMIVVSVLSYSNMKRMDRTYSDLINRRAKILVQAEQIQAAALIMNDSMKEYFLTQNPSPAQRMQAANGSVTSMVQDIAPLLDQEELKQTFAKLSELNAQYKQKADSLALLSFQEAVRTANAELFPLAKQIGDLAQTVATGQQELMNTEQNKATSAAAKEIWLTMILSIIAIILSVGGGLVTAALISRPLRKITAAAREVASGDLRDKALTIKSRDEIRDLSEAFNDMIQHLQELIRNVERTTDQVSISSETLSASAEQTTHATSQITAAAKEVSSGSESQVRGAEDSSRAMEEMAQGIGRIAESSSAVFEMATEANTRAEEGYKSIQTAVQQMNAIHESARKTSERMQALGARSDQIGAITEVITSIASQTSLLSLNASIEAARAGEHGRGFMVVAAEVKKLAVQSEDAAKQISQMIAEVQGDTKQAVALMREEIERTRVGKEDITLAGAAFSTILEAIREVSKQIEEVSATAEEISAASEQVTASVEETARIAKLASDKIRTVAAASEDQLASMQEINLSTTSLNQLAEELHQTVNKFTL